jgi:hypothetical protein
MSEVRMGWAVMASSGVLGSHSAGKACGTQITRLRALVEGGEMHRKKNKAAGVV